MAKREAAYLQLYSELKDRILKTRLKEGEKLPSKRQLADDFGMSVITVEHALRLLADEGYIEARERSGHFVVYREGNSFENAEESIYPEVASTIPIVHPQEDGIFFSTYAKTMRRTLSEYGEGILERSPNNGCLRLREAIAGYLYTNRGLEVRAEQIVIGAGAEYLYGILSQILGRDLCYGIESPSYEKIELVYKANGISYVQLPLGKNGIKSDALWNNTFDVLHVSPYRSYPSGVSADASKRREYMRWASEKTGRTIIEDDFESEFYPASKPAETIFSIAQSNGEGNVVYLNTFSKTISPSIRTGYLVLPMSLVSEYEKRAGFYSCAVPTFEQYVLSEYIESGEFARAINRIRRKHRKG